MWDAIRINSFGDSKICNFDSAIATEENIAWLDVAVDVAVTVQEVEADQDLKRGSVRRHQGQRGKGREGT